MANSLHSAKETTVRYALGILLLVLALNAFAGGYYGIMGAEAVPLEWLEGSPFSNYFIPSVILFFCVGGSALLAAILVFKHHGLAYKAALGAVVITLLWLTVQLSVIGYVSWMQPATAVTTLAIFILTWQLSRYDH